MSQPYQPFDSGYVVCPASGCWIWNKCIGDRGYGRLMYRGKQTTAHRLSWVLNVGPIPADLLVCHHCDNPPCVNPAHLFLGTALDNARDMVSKGRQGRMFGSSNPHSKLTESDVSRIRASAETQTVTASRFGIARCTVSQIKSGYRWPLEVTQK
jgi:hypothetical protein